MNNAEAKFILQGYRPNGADAGDATFCAAVEQARQDPALSDWFARQQAFDAAVSAKLAQVIPPVDLRAAILAGGRVSTAGAPRLSWWNRPTWMALAASVAVLFAAGVALWPNQAEAFDTFVLNDANESSTHGGHGGMTGALQQMLSQPGTRLGQRLPVDFAALHDNGCRTIRCENRAVLEVCFSRNGVWFHCYIARAADFPRVASGTTPSVQERNGAAMASWLDGDHLIVVVSKTGRQNLEALL